VNEGDLGVGERGYDPNEKEGSGLTWLCRNLSGCAVVRCGEWGYTPVRDQLHLDCGSRKHKFSCNVPSYEPVDTTDAD
jgi:hypothetical protein